MCNTAAQGRDEFGSGQDFTTGAVRPRTPEDPPSAAKSTRIRLAGIQSQLQGATGRIRQSAAPPVHAGLNRVIEKTSPVIDRAGAHRDRILATLVAAVALLKAVQHRRAREPVIDESIADLGNWQVAGVGVGAGAGMKADAVGEPR